MAFDSAPSSQTDKATEIRLSQKEQDHNREISGEILNTGKINGQYKHQGAKNSIAKTGQDIDASPRDARRAHMNDAQLREYEEFLRRLYQVQTRIEKTKSAIDKTIDTLNIAIAGLMASGIDGAEDIAEELKRHKEDLKQQKRKTEDFKHRAEHAETYEDAEDIEREFEKTEAAFEEKLTILQRLQIFKRYVGHVGVSIGAVGSTFFLSIANIIESLKDRDGASESSGTAYETSEEYTEARWDDEDDGSSFTDEEPEPSA